MPGGFLMLCRSLCHNEVVYQLKMPAGHKICEKRKMIVCAGEAGMIEYLNRKGENLV